jgi:glyoxylase-like metal-dependent hydrolase (beta-lactamase superfamily II)
VIIVGDVRIHVFSDGVLRLDGGSLFGIVPRVLWEAAFPPDERNRIKLAMNVVLIEAGEHRVLVDTGIGDKLGEKDVALYGVERTTALVAALAERGVAAEDVDVVVNTHLHFDHCGGNTRLEGGRLVPVFPRARYVMQKGEWEDASQPNERTRGSYREENFIPIAEAHRLELVQGETEIVPGVRVVPIGGHTAYHQMVVVESEGQRLLLPSDVLPSASHVAPAWITGFDLFPLGTLSAKKRLLDDAVESGATIAFYHDPRTPLAKVGKKKERYVLSGVTA